MSDQETHEIRVRGTVQGVGFRPTVFRLAKEGELVGEVFNDAEGVLIRVKGNKTGLDNFVRQLNVESPPLANIDAIELTKLLGEWSFPDFTIRASERGAVATEVSADAATCEHCLEEVFGENQRRYHYPFTNCTHCGPRLTIINSIPYDRSKTTMLPFPMCDSCRAEYENPLDRRFHAQPVACFDCGPKLELCLTGGASQGAVSTDTRRVDSDNKLSQVNRALRAGKIVAIRGIGGFHLCCDASNNEAVETLRLRKRRYAKPFALMTHDLEILQGYCDLSDIEREQLTSSRAPIVLLKRRAKAANGLPNSLGLPELSEYIAPGSRLYGFMMPYTPLHWLISKNFGRPLVMTSGNLSSEPQIIDNQIAAEQLNDIADLVIYHNRDIANRIDDSVVRCMAGQPRVMRRARGYAPRSFKLPVGFAHDAHLLACGAEMKSTFCLVKNGSAIVSQHQGDLEDVSTFDDYLKNLGLYQRLYQIAPQIVVHDKHPEYISTKFATIDLAEREEVSEVMSVQHHHAHIASCLVENNRPIDTSEVIGVALDGLGFGDDNSLWGGEILIADYTSSRRVGRLKPIAMLGGAQAIKEPWRNCYAHILNAMSWANFNRQYGELDIAQVLNGKPLELLDGMLKGGINSPEASSCGRLFDAVAAALGMCVDRAQFEGQGAIELEMAVDKEFTDPEALLDTYHFEVSHEPDVSHEQSVGWQIDPAPMWRALFEDLNSGVCVATISTRFHAGLVNAIHQVVLKVSQNEGINTVALSGGCLQNKLLLEGLHTRFEQAGLCCLSQSQFPSNDGGISLGQAAIALARLKQSQEGDG
ncbi:MAG: carbamoyltransferase HypF [Arenicella sp.]|nr:carbamoyltransferase HypF [Arenicella sp.]